MQLKAVLDAARQADRHQRSLALGQTTHLHATSSLDSTPKRGAPSSGWFPPQLSDGWDYNDSPDGCNDNLIMFLHGLGDTPGSQILLHYNLLVAGKERSLCTLSWLSLLSSHPMPADCRSMLQVKV